MTINFNTDPYFDDYDEDKKFYKILFRPGYPVQARELTQLQTILQTQVARHGSSIFKQGAMVIPGQMSIETDVDYVKIQNLYAGSDVSQYIDSLLGTTVTGTSGNSGTVFYVQRAEASDPHTLYIKYNKTGTDTVTKTFAASEVITNGTYSVTVAATAPTGFGSVASIQQGVYYYNGAFVLVEAQKIILDKYGQNPSYNVGLRANETIVTPEDDESLLDNAQNSYNYAAPGAHRHMIEMVLEKIDLDSTDDANFLSLSVIKDGIVQRDTRTTEYSDLEKTLARRTFDESGNYTVRNFEIDIREYRDNNRGAWVTGSPYIEGDVVSNGGKFFTCVTAGISAVAPTSTTGFGTLITDGTLVWEYTQNPVYNRGINATLPSETTLAAHRANEARLSIGLEPGKAYVQGYEIEKIATEFLTTDKARVTNPTVVNNASVPVAVGNYTLISAYYSAPTLFALVNIYDRPLTANGAPPAGGVLVGTCRIKGYEPNVVTGDYKMFLFDVKMIAGKSFERNAKSLNSGSFSCNITPAYTQLVGSASATSASPTITGVGTSFLSDLVVGDFISIGTVTGFVTAIASQTSLTLSANASATVTGSAYFVGRSKIYEPANSNLVFTLPYYATNTVADVQYQVYEALTAVTSDASGNATFTYSGSGALTSAANASNYTFFGSNTAFTPTSVTVTGNQVSITGAVASATIQCMAAVAYSGVLGATEKTKTLTVQTTVFSTVGATASVLVLDKADGFKLSRIEMDTSVPLGGSPTFAAPIDITDRYEFNNGQTDSYYGPCTVKLKASYSPPTNPIRVVFQYFTHGTGHYFSKNSYSIDYKKIPTYGTLNLRDCLDFRPRMDTVGGSMTGTAVPKRGVNITADLTYYLPRRDKVAMAANGSFFIVQGAPQDAPKDPDVDESANMVLYGLSYEPYTFASVFPSVTISRNDNKRYTMRDIGKLEKRIQSLEYYTSLSLLEQETDSLKVRDTNGLDRFKNGFAVDGFTNVGIGDTSSMDYVAAIDAAKGQLRPYFVARNANLIEAASSDAGRAASSYMTWGDLITLPLDSTTPHVELVKQPYGTRTENINPFAVFTFVGIVGLNPESDEWFSTTRLPDIVQNVEGNFNALSSALANAGVIGTVWNSWQTQWTGVPQLVSSKTTSTGPVFVGTSGAQFGYGYYSNTATTETTNETYQTVIGQTRSGITTTVTPNIVQSSAGDRILSTAIIPYIRSRWVLVQARRLKPNAQFYPFFDGVPIAPFCVPSIKIQYTLTSAKDFDVDTNVGANQTQAARNIGGDSISALNKGDLITFSNGSTAIVVNKYLEAGKSWLEVVNLVGTIVNGNTMSGSIQDGSLNVAQGTVVSSVTSSTFTTNASGDLCLLFNIPNTDAVRFRTGTREFLLIDQPTYALGFTSQGRANYFAQGVMQTKQQTILSTRNGVVSTAVAGDSRTIIETSDKTTTSTVNESNWIAQGTNGIDTSGGGGGGGDPLAQTFFVQSPGGAFLTKVDIYFASKDPTLPVSLEIREVVNGYPGAHVLPFSQVSLKPDQVNLSSNIYNVNGVPTPGPDTPTTFEFPSPVYVQDGTQYAIVLLTDTQGYNVWISNMGESMPGTDRTVSSQPNLGSLFKSQNASTWTPDQNQDLMFTLYRAKFNVGSTALPTQGLVRFVNDDPTTPTLANNPIEVRSGQTAFRVHAPNHGFTPTSTVQLSDVRVGTGTIVTTTASTTVTVTGGNFTTMGLAVGASISKTDGTFIGQVLTVGTTTVTLTANASVAVSGVGFQWQPPVAGIPAPQIFKTFSGGLTDIQTDSFVLTATSAATTSGYVGGTTIRCNRNLNFDTFQPVVQALNFPETSVSYKVTTVTGRSVNGSEAAYVPDSQAYPVMPNDNNVLSAPRVILSRLEENSKLSGDRSFKLDMVMTSSNDALSPVIDTGRISLITVSNRLNAPTASNVNYAAVDQTAIVANTLIQLSGFTVFSADGPTSALLATIPVGRELIVAGAANSANNSNCVVTSNVAGLITVARASPFVTQASGASTITISINGGFADEVTPVGSSTLSKYVSKRVNFENASTMLRVRLSVNQPVGSGVSLYYRANPVGYTDDLGKLPWVLITPDAAIPTVSVGNETFTDINYSVSAPIFDGVQVKIVLSSTSTSAVPRCKDLRIIACA